MDKATVNMTNWQLYVYDGVYNLSGTADHHPSLGKNVYVSRTSDLIDYSFTNDVLTYETRNTIYVCPLKYVTTRPYLNVVDTYKEELTHLSEKTENVLDQIISALAKLSIEVEAKDHEDFLNDSMLTGIKELQVKGQAEIEEMKQKENNRLIGIASGYEDCVYIEISNVAGGDLLAYHIGEYVGVIEPSLHSGMFQDSILYLKYATEDVPCSLDFRYWPMGWGDALETYSWSDNIKQAVIKNETGYDLQFNHITIPVGETMIFTSECHRQGLISPDCHNGKFSDIL